MDFLKHKEGGGVFYQVFLLFLLYSSNFTLEIRKRLLEFEEIH
jgi:hypothetical protein